MLIRVKVRPKSKADEIVEIMEDGTIKVRVRAVPEKGKANKAVIELLAKEYDVSKADVKIIGGATDQIKLIKINES